ncbi:hypothetical protein MVES1_003082 [Malassezia vespertilionis]|uniref:Uncharacterized protein n=1 Tax=Malassezia vespertilionis TaxID=2020962 RepID=A0A2N1J9J1_9BASI|nr:uncharacterized protein MVES1_003082 [Malassezia vespertilionis]PKI83221.1 hypothetical protein MVES_002923 [Malassezia vespertilionis]WFD07712.1 hypothetical protein MVES1_003082 [Malassezia vespertilionis]
MCATPVIVWCHPRSCSTAFERAFLQRKDTRAWHEPLGDPFYYAHDRACRRFDEDECAKSASYHTSIEQTLVGILEQSATANEGAPCRYIFIKDMALYIFSQATLHALHPDSRVFPAAETAYTQLTKGDNPTVVSTALLRRFKHTFLVRTPERSAPSYYKCTEEHAAGFQFFDPAEMGYTELKLLYDWIADPSSAFHRDEQDEEKYKAWPVQTQPMPPPLVDAAVLVAEPEATVKHYCAQSGIPFEEEMLSWKSGRVDQFEKWGTYHDKAEKSTGFYDDSKKRQTDTKQPPIVEQTIAADMPTYEYLYEKRTILGS